VTLRAAVALALGLALPAWAQDFIAFSGPVSDETLHLAIACGALPDKPCQQPMQRWPASIATSLTVTLLPPVEPVLPGIAAEVDRAIDRAIDQINTARAAIRLQRIEDNALADIRISLRDPRAIAMIASGMDDADQIAGLVNITLDDQGDIDQARIFIANDIRLTEIASVVLEEMLQGLGLPFDLVNPAYNRRSIFSEISNGVSLLTGQDAAVLRLHYPLPR
jgi:hypothetical protein